MTERDYRLQLDPGLSPSPVLPVLIWAEGIKPPQSTETAPAFLTDLLRTAMTDGDALVSAETRQRVRKMLRFGTYRPSGRGKPASEYLLQAAVGDAFPVVNGPVDVNNAVSLESGFPGSIFDADLSGGHLLLRRGRSGESYVFNPSGQTIDLEDLLLLCRRTDVGWEPCGTPVKDSMATKIRRDTQRVVAVLYAPIDEPAASLGRWASRFTELLETHCRAQTTGHCVVVP
jgi:DNA/RNA-binding domain of Phe-tRNA-synthetase-like protein